MLCLSLLSIDFLLRLISAIEIHGLMVGKKSSDGSGPVYCLNLVEDNGAILLREDEEMLNIFY